MWIQPLLCFPFYIPPNCLKKQLTFQFFKHLICVSKPCKWNAFKMGMKSLSLILPIASTISEEIIIFEDGIWFFTKLGKQYSTNVIANQLMENRAPLQKNHNFVKCSTWLKCFYMCVAHILANPPVYYVEMNWINGNLKAFVHDKIVKRPTSKRIL